MMTVLITGASSGIGAGLAKSFAADGHLVIACGRDASRLAALQQLSPNISVRLFDMTAVSYTHLTLPTNSRV